MSRTIAATATAFVLLASAANAQEQVAQEINPLLPISYGENLTGFLTTADDTLSDGAQYETYMFSGELGDTLTIALTSIDFNTHILFADSIDQILTEDGDGGGSCNAHATYVLPTSGRYIIFATSFSAGEHGEYQISLTKGITQPASTTQCAGFFADKGPLAVGDTVTATLGPPDQMFRNSYYQLWRLDVTEGDTVTVDLESIIFDAMLVEYRGFRTAIANNDDGAGACNSRLVIVGDGHPRTVMLRSAKEGESGPFLLRMTQGALPIVQTSQCEG